MFVTWYKNYKKNNRTKNLREKMLFLLIVLTGLSGYAFVRHRPDKLIEDIVRDVFDAEDRGKGYIVIIAGVPGCGKTYLAEKLLSHLPHAHRVEYDAIPDHYRRVSKIIDDKRTMTPTAMYQDAVKCLNPLWSDWLKSDGKKSWYLTMKDHEHFPLYGKFETYKAARQCLIEGGTVENSVLNHDGRWRRMKAENDRVQKLLAESNVVIKSDTSINPKDTQLLREGDHRFVFINTPKEVCDQRVKERNKQGGYFVPEQAVKGMANALVQNRPQLEGFASDIL